MAALVGCQDRVTDAPEALPVRSDPVSMPSGAPSSPPSAASPSSVAADAEEDKLWCPRLVDALSTAARFRREPFRAPDGDGHRPAPCRHSTCGTVRPFGSDGVFGVFSPPNKPGAHFWFHFKTLDGRRLGCESIGLGLRSREGDSLTCTAPDAGPLLGWAIRIRQCAETTLSVYDQSFVVSGGDLDKIDMCDPVDTRVRGGVLACDVEWAQLPEPVAR